MAFKCKVKPIAAGLSEDVKILLHSFVNLKTVNFPEFASLWKKHHFSLIFMYVFFRFYGLYEFIYFVFLLLNHTGGTYPVC